MQALCDFKIEAVKSVTEHEYKTNGEEDYYAAFVVDLDGHNTEAVYKEK